MASANTGSAEEGVALIGGSPLALPGGSTGRAANHSAGWPQIALKILLSSVFLALSLYVSLDFTRPDGHVATLWLGVGLQLGVLLLVPRRQWAAYIAAFFATNIVVMWLFGCPTAMTIGAGISNCLEALVAGLFLSRDPEWVEGRADRLAAWAKFAVIAVVLLPATAAVTGTFLFDALIHAEANIKDAQETWVTWYVGDALGIAVLTPMILRLRPRQLAELRRRGRILEAVALVGAFGAFALAVFLQGGVLALFLILPPLIILLYRIGFVGLAAGMGIFVPLALAVTMAGRGPFVAMADGDAARAVVLCQAFSMLAFGIVVLVGALLDDRHRLYKITEDRHGELRRELEAAAMIQAALLPGTKAIGGLTCSGLFLPSSVVAGDTYDVLERADGRIAFFLLDVSGHGAPAALVSVAAHHALAQAALTHARTQGLDEVVAGIERSWPGNLPYFTMIFGELDPATGKGAFVQAGHPPPLVLGRDGSVTAIGGSGYPIGLVEGTSHDAVGFTLAEGERLLMYSDGLVEAEDESGRPFSAERLWRLVEQQPAASSRELLSALERELRVWCGTVSLKDDVTVLLIERKGAQNEAAG